jgi:hypothetical protein
MIPFPSKSANFSPVRIFSRARRHRDRAVSLPSGSRVLLHTHDTGFTFRFTMHDGMLTHVHG